MQKQDLISYLTGIGPASIFFSKIRSEVSIYEKALSKNGASCAVSFTGKESLEINQKHLARLYTAFRKSEISLAALAYISDAITMDEDFTFNNPMVEEIAHEFSELGSMLRLTEEYIHELDLRVLNSRF